jgi:hypothetical protein
MAKAKGKARNYRIIGVRATDEWADWLERLAEAHRTTVAGLVDRALTEWAESRGFAEKPPKRTP